MSAMADFAIYLGELIETKQYGRVLETLKSWGDDAPAQLWAVLELLAELEREAN